MFHKVFSLNLNIFISLRYQVDTVGRYETLSSVYKDVYSESGFRGFFRGLVPTILRAAPVDAVCLLFYELSMKLLNNLE